MVHATRGATRLGTIAAQETHGNNHMIYTVSQKTSLTFSIVT